LPTEPVRPRLASATLARLYLAQGHVETAQAISRELSARGAPGVAEVEDELGRVLSARERVLHELLADIRLRRSNDDRTAR
jgi:hypothetical protein